LRQHLGLVEHSYGRSLILRFLFRLAVHGSSVVKR
jgi:hypothetical protein